MTNQQWAPEALRLANALDNSTSPWTGERVMFADAAAELRRLHAENVRLAALVEAQQPAPSAAAVVVQDTDPVAKRRAAYLRNDTDAGRAYVAQYLRSMGQHYFDDYIKTDLAGDFACALASALSLSLAQQAPQPSPTPQAGSPQDEPLQAFDSPRAKALMRAWEEGWAACRDAEYVGEEAQNDAFNSSNTLTLCIAEDQQLPAPQADSQPAPIDMVLHCPKCGMQHIDAPDERTPDWKNEPHRSHLCHGCGHIWRPADVPTNGVKAVKTTGKADSPIAAPTPPVQAREIEGLRKDAEANKPTASGQKPIAYVDGDDAVRRILWEPNQAAFDIPVGTKLYAYPALSDAADAERYQWLRRWKGQEHEPPFTVRHEVDGTLWGGDLDAAIDAARKQGGKP